MGREKVIKGLECCFRGNDCRNCPYKEVFNPERPNLDCIDMTREDAIALLKEQDDMGKELTNAMELIHKKNERIKKLEEQIETLTRWRANAGAFD